MTIWNGASPGSDAWVVVELVHLSNGWFRFQRGADKFVHWGGTGIEPADAGDDDVFDPWNTPLRPALVSARSFESTLRSPESCKGGVRFLGMGQSASGPTFSLCLIDGVFCTFLPDGTVLFGSVELREDDVARWR